MLLEIPELVVLVVEDEPAIREIIVAYILDAGWAALEASSGEMALALLASEPRIDVLITDVSLEGKLTGWDVAEAFRNARREIPVVYATGNPFDRSREVDGSVFFQKPFSPTDLVETCRQLTGRAA